MDRLTYRNKNGDVGLIGEKESLTSIEVVDLINNALDKLFHYEELADARRLIELPCAVGDTVWVATFDYTDPFGDEIEYVVIEEKFELYMLKDFGVDLFLTKEEAEAKVKELEGDRE